MQSVQQTRSRRADRCNIGSGEYTMIRSKNIPILLSCLPILLAGVLSMADEVMDENSQSCISTRTLTSTRILDDRNILFFRTGKTVYRNILPNQCPGLSRYGSFSYGTLAGSICERDIIRIIDNDMGLPGKSCVLGSFQKITNEAILAMIEGRFRPVESAPLPPSEVEDVTEEVDEPQDETQK